MVVVAVVVVVERQQIAAAALAAAAGHISRNGIWPPNWPTPKHIPWQRVALREPLPLATGQPVATAVWAEIPLSPLAASRSRHTAAAADKADKTQQQHSEAAAVAPWELAAPPMESAERVGEPERVGLSIPIPAQVALAV